jgi:hypothetical protein
MRTIAGLGSWSGGGWILSGEMNNAVNVNHKYTFEILKGYEFERGNIFKEYVNTMYNLRMEYEKGHPINLTANLLMNFLYGMRLEITKVEMFNCSDQDQDL